MIKSKTQKDVFNFRGRNFRKYKNSIKPKSTKT
jgi:hypothetical protein